MVQSQNIMNHRSLKEIKNKIKLGCQNCDGSGKVFWPGVSGKNYPCPTCGGSGKAECFLCKGVGLIKDKKKK